MFHKIYNSSSCNIAWDIISHDLFAVTGILTGGCSGGYVIKIVRLAFSKICSLEICCAPYIFLSAFMLNDCYSPVVLQ